MTKIVKPTQNNRSSRGASNAFKGIKQGTSTSFNLNGLSNAKFNKEEMSGTNTDSTQESKTIKGSSTINQHKRLAQTGHT